MIRDDVSLLLDIENSYESVKLNLEAIGWLQYLLGSNSHPIELIIHLNYLCGQDASAHLAEMKQAIDALKQVMKSAPGQEVEAEGVGQ